MKPRDFAEAVAALFEAEKYADADTMVDANISDASEALSWSVDKIQGLEADLDSAVEVAWKRGATEWVRLNYPKHFTRLTAFAEAGEPI